MAQPTNTYSRYQAVGVKEDISDIISNISPVETPFISNAGTAKANQTYFEWQTDALAAGDVNNAFVEGDTTAAAAISPTTRVGNYTQISKKVISITGTLEATDKAGRKSELAYQMTKKSKELKRDIETIATSSQIAVAGSDSVARKTAAFDPWLKTNVSNGASGTNFPYTTVPNAARTTDGTDRAFTETLLKTVVGLQWAAGGMTKILMTGPVNKGKFSGMSGIAETRFDAGKGQARIIGAADVYTSDFGDVVAVPNRFMPEDRAYLIDPDYVKIAYLRPFFKEQLAKTGDADNWHMVTEWGLKVDNEQAHGVIRDLLTT